MYCRLLKTEISMSRQVPGFPGKSSGETEIHCSGFKLELDVTSVGVLCKHCKISGTVGLNIYV